MATDNDDIESLSRPLYALSPPWHVALASLLGGPLGGSAVLVMNYARRDRMLPALLTATVGFWASAAAALAAILEPQWTTYLAIAVLAALAFTLLAWLVDGHAYRRHLGRGGATVPLHNAALIGAGCTLAAVAAYFGVRHFAPVSEYQVSERESIYYTGTATEADAQRLARYLQDKGFLNGQPVTLRLHRKDDQVAVGVVLQEGGWLKPKAVAYYSRLRQDIARDVFPGQPVQLELLDSEMEVRKVVE